MKILRALTIVSLIALVSCGQPKTLSGKYQLESGEMGVEFLEDNNMVLQTVETGIAMKYEILKGEDGQKIKFDGPFLNGQVLDFKREGDTIILSNAEEERVFRKVDEFSLAGESSATKARQSEAKTFVGSLNRSQQAHFVEFGQFANSFSELVPSGLPTETSSYSYSMTSLGSPEQGVITFAQAKEPNLKSYWGRVAMEGNTTPSIVCHTDDPATSLPTTVDVQSEMTCPPGLSPVGQ